MATNTPNNYKDPYWTDLATATEAKLGLPDGLLAAIVTKGERSNHDQVSEAGARTVFQIIPATRKAAIDKYGIDPYLNPENAAEVAGLLLKDSLDRNKGNVQAAVAEYHGGTDRSNWGPRTRSYVARVVGDQQQISQGGQPSGGSTFQRVMAANPQYQQNSGAAPSQINQVYQAYKAGKMTPEEAGQFEADVKAGLVMLPKGSALNGQTAQSPTEKPVAMMLPKAISDAYVDGKLSEQERNDLEADMKAGLVKLPVQTTSLIPTDDPNWQPPTEQGIIQRPKEPTLGERLVGAGEAGLTTLAGMTGGTLGMIGGTIGGLTASILNGDFGTQKAADMVEQAAMGGAQQLTYMPRTETGREYAQIVGDAVQQTVPMVPLTAEMGMLGQAIRNARPAVNAATRAGAATAVTKAGQVADAVKPPVAAAVNAVKSAPGRVAEVMGMKTPEVAAPTPGTGGSVGAMGTDVSTMRRIAGEELPVPVELTKGQATRDFGQLRFEQEAAKNPELGAPIRERMEQQNRAVRQSFDAWLDETGAQAPDNRAVGIAVDKALTAKAARDKAEIRVAYKEAEKAGEMQAPISTKQVVDALNTSQSAESTAPVLTAAKKELVRLGGAVEDANGQLIPVEPTPSAPGGLPIGETTLKPGADGAVWLTKDPERAMRYARQAAEKNGGEPVVVRVRESEAPQDPTNFGDNYTRATAQAIPIESKIVGKVTPEEGYWYHGTSQQKSSGGMSLGNMEQLRKFVNKVTGNDPTNVKFAGDLKRAIDASTEGAGGGLYAKARGLRAKYAEQYENRAVISDLLSNKRGMSDRKVALEDVADRVIFRGSLDDLRFARKVLQTGGEEGKQAWREIQGSALRSIRDEATKGITRDSTGNEVISASGLDKAIKRLDNEGKLDHLFGKQGAEKLRAVNDLAKVMFTTPPGAVNTSNTASVLLAAMDMALSGSAGMPLPVMSGLKMLVKNVKDRKLRARINDALNQKGAR